jgi:hypothetical protein
MTMARKIKVGDWFIAPSGQVFDVCFVATSGTYISDTRGVQYRPDEIKLLPSSPATLAKSHRLLMRWCGEHQKPVGGNSLSAHIAMENHCRRLAGLRALVLGHVAGKRGKK